MHVSTRNLLQKHFSRADLDTLGPLVKHFFTDDAEGLTDAYLAKLLGASRSNFYLRRKRLLETLKPGADYTYALSADNKRVIRFTHDAFLRCVRRGLHPSVRDENRKRVSTVLDFDRLTASIHAAHNRNKEARLQRARKTLMRMKQGEVKLKDDVAMLERRLDRVQKELDEAESCARKHSENIHPALGQQLRNLLATMGLSLDESQKKEIRDSFSLLSRRMQGTVVFDVKQLRGERRDVFLVDPDQVEDLCADINKGVTKLPLK